MILSTLSDLALGPLLIYAKEASALAQKRLLALLSRLWFPELSFRLVDRVLGIQRKRKHSIDKHRAPEAI
jgi:hypothetical protein